jgi:hypothetical protein
MHTNGTYEHEHTRKKSAIPPADVNLDVKNSGYKQKVCEFSVKPKAFHQTSAPTSQFWNFFILNLCSFHFHYVAIILHLWLMKFYMPEKCTYFTR